MRNVAILTAAALAIAASPTFAKEVTVQMLNKGANGVFVYDAPIVHIAPGDTVHFVAKDKGHDVESIAGMIPAGASPFKGEMSKDLDVKFTVPGVYGYKCMPHYAMGMVGLVVVGKATNLAQAKAVSHPGKAKQVFDGLLAQVK